MPEIIPPSFDALTLAAVAAEIRAYVGARFAGVRQPGPQDIVISLRNGGQARHLLFSIHPRTARAHFAAPPETTERLAPFGLLLRSRLIESRLAGVEQPPFERVLRLSFDALEGPLVLIAETMGRHSNLIFADARVVLGSLKVVTERMSPRRPVLPGRPYLPPPADRPSPDTVDTARIRDLLAGDRPLWQALAGGLQGVSPVLAREIALRSGLDPALSAADASASADRIEGMLREISSIMRTGAWSPTAYEDGGRVVAFSAIPLQVYGHVHARPSTTMSEAVDRYYRSIGDDGPLEERRRTLASAVRALLRQREAALENNRRALAESQTADRLRVQGELLLAYAGRVGPGDVSVTVPDHTAGGSDTVIPLDPTLSPVENAQHLFRRYQKARATARALPARIADLTAETHMLREALVQIVTAALADDLWEIHADLAGRGMLRRAPRARPVSPRGPRRFEIVNGAVILAGRSARENDHLTFHVAGPDDLWFHARGIPGAHVVLKAGGTPTDASVVAAAQVAAYYSEGREGGQVAVDYVPRKRVRRARGSPPGAVTYDGEQTLLVAPGLPPSTPAPR